MKQNLPERWLQGSTKAMAISGGVLLIVLIIMSLISIISRKLGYGSLYGDIELMEAGSAVAIAAFFPYCTLMAEHLKVDFFTNRLSTQTRRRIDGLCDLLLGMVSLMLTVYTAASVIETWHSQEVTPLVSLPLWLPVMLLLPGLGLMALAGLYRGAISLFTSGVLLGESQ